MMMFKSSVLVAVLYAASVTALVARAPAGTQFITGPCSSDADCANGCCGFNSGKCAGAIVAQERDGGCGHGDAQPNNNAAVALVGPSAPKPAGAAAAAAPAAAPAAAASGSGSVTVKAGDTCTTIAAANGISASALQAANPSINSGCTNLQVGQTLTLSGGGAAAAAPAAAPAAAAKAPGNAQGFVTSPCTQDSDCQQGCCAFNTGKCAGPDIAQTRDGGCGFGSPAPNCNVASLLKLNACAAGAKNGDLSDPTIIAAAKFVSNLDGIPFSG